MAQRICSVDDCDTAHFGKGFCQKHYKRWRKHGDPQMGAAVRLAELCAADGCERAPRSRDLCSMHLFRVQKYGEIEPIFAPPKPRPRSVGVDPCSIDGCDLPIRARGWCATHYSRWRRKGDPLHRLRAEVVDGKRICPTCEVDTPIEDWYATPSGEFLKCRECYREWGRTQAHLRRAVAEGPKFTRREVLDRDQWICQLCSLPISKTLQHPDPMSPTLDHIIPLSRGGVHSLSNSQAAHRICNMRKWANVA